MNTPLGGEDPMEGTPVLTFDTHLTAVAATSTGDYTVVFVGTNEGHLKKVSARYSLSPSIEEEQEARILSLSLSFINPTLYPLRSLRIL